MAASDDDPTAVLDAVGGLGRERASRERARDALLARTVSVHAAGFATLDFAPLLAAPADVAEQALSAIVAMLGGGLYPPRRRRVSRLLRVLAGDADGGYTLAGCRFVLWRSRYLVLRELAAAATPARILPGKRLVWDRRFEVALSAAAAGPVTLNYLDETGVAELNGRAPVLPRTELPLLVRPILPALWDEGGIAAVPHLGYRREGVCLLPELVFRPVKSLSDAGFAVVKAGALLMS